MAVIQISRIQQRRGQTAQTGFPQLASGEFGWSIDTQELYIGNGSVSEGAPAIGNTRLITENDSNFFLLAGQGYTYGDSLPNSAVDALPRSIQNKLDDIVNLNDFINVNSTASDSTNFIQNAINYAAGIKKPLYVPEGTYLVTGTVFIPPYTEIRGAGPNKTVFSATTVASIFQTVDANGNTLTNITSSAKTPQGVYVNGLTFLSPLVGSTSSMVLLDCLHDSVIENCVFEGNKSVISTSTQVSGIELRGQASALTCDNVSIKDCIFRSLNSAIRSNYDMSNIHIVDNKFGDTSNYGLNTGIVFAKNLLDVTSTTTQFTGPTNVNINGNTFFNISNQAIFVGTNSEGISFVGNIKSSNNIFTRVGNGYGSVSESRQATEVIAFNSFGNLSIGDTFARFTNFNTSTITTSSVLKPIIHGPVTVASVVQQTKILNTATYSIFVWPKAVYTVSGVTSPGQNITIDYTLYKPSISTSTQAVVRRGTIEAVVNGSTSTITDNFTANGSSDGNTVFRLNLTTTSTAIIVQAVNSGVRGFLTYTTTVRQ